MILQSWLVLSWEFGVSGYIYHEVGLIIILVEIFSTCLFTRLVKDWHGEIGWWSG